MVLRLWGDGWVWEKGMMLLRGHNNGDGVYCGWMTWEMLDILLTRKSVKDLTLLEDRVWSGCDGWATSRKYFYLAISIW